MPFGGLTALAAALLPLLTLLVAIAVRRPLVIGDSITVVAGAEAALGCLRAGTLVGCPRVSFYPPFQYVPAALARLAGVSRQGTLALLASLNAAALVAMLALTLAIGRRAGSMGVARAGAAVLTAGMLPVYAVSTFGEALAAALVLTACASILLGWRPALQMLAFAAAATTKETAPVLLAVLAALSLVVARGRLGTTAASPLAIAIGVGLGAGCNLLFNVFRYGTPLNATYVAAERLVPSLQLWASFAAANLVAPNAGLLFFWPLALLAVAASVGVVWQVRRVPVARWRAAAAALAPAVLVGLALVYGRWWSPFGWNSWGPRFLVPWLPSLALLCLLAADEELDGLWRVATHRLGDVPARTITTLLVAALALPALGNIADHAAFDRFFAFGDATCPRVPQLGDWGYYYPCIRHQAWAHRPWLVASSLGGILTPLGVALAAGAALASVAIVFGAVAIDEPAPHERTDRRRG